MYTQLENNTTYFFTRRSSNYGYVYNKRLVKKETEMFLTDEYGNRYNKKTGKECKANGWRITYLITPQEYIEGLNREAQYKIDNCLKRIADAEADYLKIKNDAETQIELIKSKMKGN